MSAKSLWSLDPTTYVPHELHRRERAWQETNCYVDLWIEVLHAMKLDPVACMGFTLRVDFEGDQWTFFKPPHRDLMDLYGLAVEELNVWRDLRLHCLEQIAMGRMVMVEADAFYLPDTAGSDYKTQHTKTTIGVEMLDVEREQLGYFHNGGYYTVQGHDYRGVFRVGFSAEAAGLPPFAEFVKPETLSRLALPELSATSIALAREHFALRPKVNPISAYKERFVRDIEWLKTEPLATFHAYAFATMRQLGACFELAAYYVRWLEKTGHGAFEPAAIEFDNINNTTKAMQFKIARAVGAKKNVDFAPTLASIEASWDAGMDKLGQLLGR